MKKYVVVVQVVEVEENELESIENGILYICDSVEESEERIEELFRYVS